MRHATLTPSSGAESPGVVQAALCDCSGHRKSGTGYKGNGQCNVCTLHPAGVEDAATNSRCRSKFIRTTNNQLTKNAKEAPGTQAMKAPPHLLMDFLAGNQVIVVAAPSLFPVYIPAA